MTRYRRTENSILVHSGDMKSAPKDKLEKESLGRNKRKTNQIIPARKPDFELINKKNNLTLKIFCCFSRP